LPNANIAMRAEIISIGDELTTGQRLDTNSQWLSQRLGELGIATWRHTTVGDNLDDNVAVFRAAADKADVVISTGGLGPTADDLTRESLAKLIDRPLKLDEASLEHIRALFARRKRAMPERNVIQAMFPEGSRPIFNPHGTAPGIALDVPRADGSKCQIFSLPGVPAEMFEMFTESVAPELAAASGPPRVIVHRAIRCFGVGESDLEAMLPDLIRRGRTPTVGITVSDATITLRITAVAATREECEELIAPTVATIHECLGELAYGEGEDELADVVLRQLIARGETLSTVEWGNAGLAWAMHQAMEKAIAGKSSEEAAHWRAAYRGGVTIGDAPGAAMQLGASYDWSSTPPTSAEMATALAESARKSLQTDWCLATAEYPPFVSRMLEPNKLQMAIAGPCDTVSLGTPYAGHPAILKPRAAKQALNFLRLKLLREASTAGDR
jgi:nicotinamide-nucleotide amidase